MAFTRQFIRNLAKESGVELPKEMEEALIAEHISARDAHAEEQVKADREANPGMKPEDSDVYKNLKKEFEDYKADIAAKEGSAAKEKAYRALIAEVGIDPQRADTVVRKDRSVFEAEKLDKNGRFEKEDDLKNSIRTDWEGYLTTKTTTGVPVATPPAQTGGKTAVTKADIMKIKNSEERQRAIAENIDLFRKG